MGRKPMTDEEREARRQATAAWVALERHVWWNSIGRGYGCAARRHFAPDVTILDDRTFSTMGVRGTTPVHVKRWPNGWIEARCGMAIMGYAADTTGWDSDPFADDFRDNYLSGSGITLMDALEDLKKGGMETADALFA